MAIDSYVAKTARALCHSSQPDLGAAPMRGPGRRARQLADSNIAPASGMDAPRDSPNGARGFAHGTELITNVGGCARQQTREDNEGAGALGILVPAVVGVAFGFVPWLLAAFALATMFVVMSGLVGDRWLASGRSRPRI
jgi:hypothetical protein